MSMISHHHRLIFLHNPKTGGCSTQNVIGEMGFNMSWIDPLWNSAIDQHCHDIPEDFSDYRVFCMWRNPFDRHISRWAFHLQREEDIPPSTTPQQAVNVLDYTPQRPFIEKATQRIPFEMIGGGFHVEGLGPIVLNKRENKTEHLPWWEYYDDELASLILRHDEEDFDCIERIAGINLRGSWKTF